MLDNKEAPKILIVDDEENIRHYLRLVLTSEGYDIAVSEDAPSAMQQLAHDEIALVLCDIRMPGKMDGMALLSWIKEEGISSEVIMMSAYGSKDIALKAVRAGAYDYIDKPIRREELLLTIEKFFERERLRKENRKLREVLKEKEGFSSLIYKSSQMKRVLEIAQKVAKYPSTVLLTGETGTGKDLLARFIHQKSQRSFGQFVAVNCGSLPRELLESELFGHAKGAFTGAHKEHAGLFEEAHRGTLFLDEISELPLELQVKLLRILQENSVRRVGETKTRPIDVRIIAATNRNLEQLVEEGLFREDLFHRLEVFHIVIPPLRERSEDIPELANHFLKIYNARFKRQIEGIEPEAMRAMMNYHWPGNVRELKNVIERAIVLEESPKITVSSLHPKLLAQRTEAPFQFLENCLSIKKGTKRLEEYLIKKALEKTGGNRSAAARLLEISHRALLYKLKDYGLDKKEET